MKTRIAIGAALLLTLGSAVAGSIIYGQERNAPSAVEPATVATPADRNSVTPEMIAMWKATAASADYAAPRMPI